MNIRYDTKYLYSKTRHDTNQLYRKKTHNPLKQLDRRTKRSTKRPYNNTKGSAIAFVQSTLNNTLISITNAKGDVKTWASSGTAGFQGARRSTHYAAQVTAERAARGATRLGIRYVQVKVKGLGYGKQAALRGLRLGGLSVILIRDITPMPHNGCRPPKKRRV